MKKNHFYLGNDEFNHLAIHDEENNYDYDEKTYVYDESIKNDSHVAVVRQIKEGSTVLDIGCASGILGSTIVKYKNCIVDGIEYDKKACEVTKSKKVYRNVYNFSISDLEGKEYKKFYEKNNKYDYIVFADVLEHLVDPWNALINVSKLLDKNGKIIVSLPNISHIDIIKGLINKEFNYTKWGILDQTHLRFFTPSSFKDMINNIASEKKVYFNVDKIEDILIKPEYFVDSSEYSLFNINSNLESYLALQNVYVLSVAKDKKSMTSNIKNTDANNFDKMLENYNNAYAEISKLTKDIENMNKYIEVIQAERDDANNQYNKIVNSKRYKIINKLLKLIGK